MFVGVRAFCLEHMCVKIHAKQCSLGVPCVLFRTNVLRYTYNSVLLVLRAFCLEHMRVKIPVKQCSIGLSRQNTL